MMSDRQKEIKNWFDHTYAQRGSWYLRPSKAYYIFIEILKAKKSEKLLDIACGLGRLLEVAGSYCTENYGIDISEVAIKKTKEKFPALNVFVANAEQLPFENETFDLVTCIGSLERMIHIDLVLKEMHRVGKAHCRYCLLVRNSEAFRWKYIKILLGLRNKRGNQNAKKLDEWRTVFQNFGFKILAVYPDQYNLAKKMKRRSLWLKKINYKKLIHTERPLTASATFIFLLQKDA